MKNRMLLRKTCGIYASETHFATLIFPFIRKEVKANTKVITILEKDETEKIEKILKNIGLNSKIKKKIKAIDWSKTNIKKIRKNFKLMEENIKNKINIDIIIMGNQQFIKKLNDAIDLWFSNNIKEIEKAKINLNIINCFSFFEGADIYKLVNTHDYILKTKGRSKIIEEKLMKAN